MIGKPNDSFHNPCQHSFRNLRPSFPIQVFGDTPEVGFRLAGKPVYAHPGLRFALAGRFLHTSAMIVLPSLRSPAAS